MRGRKWFTATKAVSLKTPGGFGFPGFFFSLLELELDNDGVVGRTESGGKGLGKSGGGADGLFDRVVHGGIARRPGDAKKCYHPAFRNLNLHFGVNLFASWYGGLFPGGLDALFD